MKRLGLLLLAGACLAPLSAKAQTAEPGYGPASITMPCDAGFTLGAGGCRWTQAASSSASLAWTGLAGSDYRLTCRNIVPATDNVGPYIQFGEGATPTWVTTGYAWARAGTIFSTGGALGSNSSTSDIGIAIGGLGLANTAGDGLSGSADLYNVNATVRHAVAGHVQFRFTGSGDLLAVFGGFYGTDTNPITAVRVILSSGNISTGSCTLTQL